mgnify:CR=1 FL=1
MKVFVFSGIVGSRFARNAARENQRARMKGGRLRLCVGGVKLRSASRAKRVIHSRMLLRIGNGDSRFRLSTDAWEPLT